MVKSNGKHIIGLKEPCSFWVSVHCFLKKIPELILRTIFQNTFLSSPEYNFRKSLFSYKSNLYLHFNKQVNNVAKVGAWIAYSLCENLNHNTVSSSYTETQLLILVLQRLTNTIHPYAERTLHSSTIPQENPSNQEVRTFNQVQSTNPFLSRSFYTY